MYVSVFWRWQLGNQELHGQESRARTEGSFGSGQTIFPVHCLFEMSREAFALPKYFNTNIDVDSNPQSAMEYLFQVRKEAEAMPSIYSIANDVVQHEMSVIIDRRERCTRIKSRACFWSIYQIISITVVEGWWFWRRLGRECGSGLYPSPKSIYFCQIERADDWKKKERGSRDICNFSTCERWKWLGILLLPEAWWEECTRAIEEALQVPSSQRVNPTRLCTNRCCCVYLKGNIKHCFKLPLWVDVVWREFHYVAMWLVL